MSAPTFTPGPWGDGNEAILVKVDRERPWAGTVFSAKHDGSEANALVAMTFGASVEEVVANARLIAAAPELLEALETASWLLSDISPDGLVKKKVDSAIAKARGEQVSA